MVIAFVMLVLAGRAGAQENVELDPLLEFQYRFEEATTYRFLVENVDLVHADWHVSARESGNPVPGKSADYGTFMHAYEGDDLKEGTGAALIWRTGESMAGPIHTSAHAYWYKTLTIHLPELATDGPVTLDLSGGDTDGATVFWTFWGHYRDSCYAYPTGGTIKLKPVPRPRGEIDLDTLEPIDRSNESIVADLDIRFDEIVVDHSFSDPSDPDCPAFALKERVIFHRNPLKYVPWREKPGEDAGKPEQQETKPESGG